MPDILSIADHADMIVNGYAFSKSNDSVRVLNLNNPASACVLSADGKILETTMDDIELDIVQDGNQINVFFFCRGTFVFCHDHKIALVPLQNIRVTLQRRRCAEPNRSSSVGERGKIAAVVQKSTVVHKMPSLTAAFTVPF